jgi:hypothetical protein
MQNGYIKNLVKQSNVVESFVERESQGEPLKRRNPKPILCILVAILIAACLVFAYGRGLISGQSSGQTWVWDNIRTKENQLRDLYSNSIQTQLNEWLSDAPMNFTDGLIWESQKINYTENRPQYQNVIQVLQNGKGACGEFVWVFGAFCAAKDIPFRMITVGYFVPNVVDHAWAQVNPSHDGKTWIHVEVTDSCAQLAQGATVDQLWNKTINNNSQYYGSHYKMVLAYEFGESGDITITDVTSTFSPP